MRVRGESDAVRVFGEVDLGLERPGSEGQGRVVRVDLDLGRTGLVVGEELEAGRLVENALLMSGAVCQPASAMSERHLDTRLEVVDPNLDNVVGGTRNVERQERACAASRGVSEDSVTRRRLDDSPSMLSPRLPICLQATR